MDDPRGWATQAVSGMAGSGAMRLMGQCSLFRLRAVAHCAGIALVLAAAPVGAQQFEPLSGAEITAALDDVTLVYDGGAVQTFYASGRTLYDAGQESWGSWRVQGDQYCSEWPPNAGWDCYDMDSDGTVLRFISDRGHITVGRVQAE
ncbi:hypothetical protein [Shimia ponticola]|uniref:hypothetical protein n=1 Tax=Shimia ponticola TaxID=2582893 RepID=UPI0011BE47CC|nr:hypothetical protein [Shimia ponticola]